MTELTSEGDFMTDTGKNEPSRSKISRLMPTLVSKFIIFVTNLYRQNENEETYIPTDPVNTPQLQ